MTQIKIDNCYNAHFSEPDTPEEIVAKRFAPKYSISVQRLNDIYVTGLAAN